MTTQKAVVGYKKKGYLIYCYGCRKNFSDNNKPPQAKCPQCDTKRRGRPPKANK